MAGAIVRSFSRSCPNAVDIRRVRGNLDQVGRFAQLRESDTSQDHGHTDMLPTLQRAVRTPPEQHHSKCPEYEGERRKGRAPGRGVGAVGKSRAEATAGSLA
jgi:hypothetical protein